MNVAEDARLSPAKAFDYFHEKSRGFDKLGFTQPDHYNYVSGRKREQTKNGPCRSIM